MGPSREQSRIVVGRGTRAGRDSSIQHESRTKPLSKDGETLKTGDWAHRGGGEFSIFRYSGTAMLPPSAASIMVFQTPQSATGCNASGGITAVDQSGIRAWSEIVEDVTIWREGRFSGNRCAAVSAQAVGECKFHRT